uniref:Reelin domain-containing protein n=1 Tax=Steinernema glaseri TaxID=37863 RepID=A0A1I7Y9E6_9BILA
MAPLSAAVFLLFFCSASALNRQYEGVNISIAVHIPTADCLMAGTASTINITLGYVGLNDSLAFSIRHKNISSLKGSFERKDVFDTIVNLGPELSNRIEKGCAAMALQAEDPDKFYGSCFSINFIHFKLAKRFWNFQSNWKPGNIEVSMILNNPSGEAKTQKTVFITNQECSYNWVHDTGNTYLRADRPNAATSEEIYFPRGPDSFGEEPVIRFP